MIDQILAGCGLSRANLIYSGGGHCYILLPNTKTVIEKIDLFAKEVNAWLLDRYNISLFVATGYTACTANELMNSGTNPKVSPYKEVFRKINNALGESKLQRYLSPALRKLNSGNAEASARECKTCGAVRRLPDNADLCSLCGNLIAISRELIKDDVLIFITRTNKEIKLSVELPSICGKTLYLSCLTVKEARDFQKNRIEDIVSIYGINKIYTGMKNFSRLWMGTYYSSKGEGQMDTFEELSDSAEGISRLGVLRADVDCLGRVFIEGFEKTNIKDRYQYVSLARYAALSRQLSLFFKKHMNEILSQACSEERFFLHNAERQAKKATIVYSGGDDLFIVGAWTDSIEAAVDLYRIFEKYTGGALTFSAGIGIFDCKFPISRMAEITAELESEAKAVDEDKNAISIFGTAPKNEGGFIRHTYKWERFINRVLGEKFALLKKYFVSTKAYNEAGGNAFLYRIMDLAASADDKINIARCAYLLGRLAPQGKGIKEKQEMYTEFSQSIYRWILTPEDREELITAIHIFVYLKRERKENRHGQETKQSK